MGRRILTAAIGIVVFFAVLACPSAVFTGAVALVTALMLYELHKAMGAHPALYVLSFLSLGLYTYGLFSSWLLPALVVMIFLYMILTISLFGKVSFKEIFASAFLSLLVSVFMAMLSMIRQNHGVAFALLVFVCAWITDSGAYFSGYFFGKHKLAPNLSPKKTIEGAVGGTVCCVLFCMLYLWILSKTGLYTVTSPSVYLAIGVMGLVASVVSQCGDLLASAIKRDCGVKDYGSILPGHGGAMDRFDSVLFVTPLIYCVLFYMNIL